MLIVQLAVILGTAIGLLIFTGYSISRALPVPFHLYRYLLMPVVGYAGLVVLAYPLIQLRLNTVQIAAPVIAVFAAVNLAAWRLLPQPMASAKRETVAALALGLLGLSLALAPLFAYGALTVIGYNADASIYIPVAEFAKEHGLTPTAFAVMASPFASAGQRLDTAGLGFQLFASSISWLAGRDAFFSFAPLLALWHGLAVLQAFVASRLAFGMSFRAALGVAFLAAVNTILLWIAFDNFARQVVAVAILPLALATAFVYFREPSRRTLYLGALTVAALLGTYPEVLAFYALPLGAWFLFQNRAIRREPSKWVKATSGLTAVSIALAPYGYLAWIGNTMRVLPVVAERATGNITEFISLAQGLALQPLELAQLPATIIAPELTNILTAFSILGVILTIGFGLVGMWSVRQSRYHFLGICSVTFLMILLWLRFGSVYEYGFFKAWGNIVFAFLALCVLGIEQSLDWFARRPHRRLWLAFGAASLVFLTALEFLSVGVLLDATAARAPAATRKLVVLAANKEVLPPNASVLLPLREDPIPPLYWAAYLMGDRNIYGNGRLAYQSLHNAVRDKRYPFALLLREDDPLDFGYLPEEKVWEDRWLVLYQAR